jgi:hypothetical protein
MAAAMKPAAALIGFAWAATLCAQQPIEEGKTVRFGQTVEEIQRLFPGEPTEINQPGARTGIDRRIVAKRVNIDFDTGRVAQLHFRANFPFEAQPLTPFPEPWKNFEPMDEVRLKRQMTRDEFMVFFDAWEKRAAAMGRRRDADFRVIEKDGERLDTLTIWMRPSRAGPNGATWSDGWRVAFLDQGLPPNVVPKLSTITAICGEFNSRPPNARMELFAAAKKAAKSVTAPELPKPEVPKPPPEPPSPTGR